MKRRGARLLVALLALLLAAAVRPPRAVTPGGDAADVPPNVAVTAVALGGLNGLVVDLLWMRAAQQQEEGRYFEMLQTAEWMAALQPQLGGLFDFQAWNMAYNIAGEFSAPEDRWRWVLSGLRLLLDQGLRRQPNRPAIPAAIAEIIFGKVADAIDEASPFYRAAWATEWQRVLGGPGPGVRDPARLREAWRMDPARVARIDAAYGPFDWRTPEPHAVYWATLALERAGAERHLPTERLLYQALWGAFQRGRLAWLPGTTLLETGPDLRALPAAERELDACLARHPGDAGLLVARRNLRTDAVVAHLLFGDETAARREAAALGVAPDQVPGLVLAVAGLEPGASAAATHTFAAEVLTRACRFEALGAGDQSAGLRRLARLAWRQAADRASRPPLEALEREVRANCRATFEPELARRLAPAAGSEQR